MKKQPTDYLYVDKNIYRNGPKGTYRVRVGKESSNARTLTQAKSVRRLMKANQKSTPIW